MKNLKDKLLYLTIGTFLAVTTSCSTLPEVKRYEVPLRIVSVKVAHDEEYMRKAKKRKHIKIVEEASKSLEEQVGIRLVIKEEGYWDSEDKPLKWNPKTGKMEMDIAKTLKEMEAEVGHGKSEIIIGFTGQYYEEKSNGKRYRVTGLAEGVGRGNCVLISDYSFSPKRTTIHEISHLFGASHTGVESVMNPGSSTEIIDDWNKESVMRNKFRWFYGD